jgi:paraquat-inducible protein A
MASARGKILVACHDCDLLVQAADRSGGAAKCPRCAAVLFRMGRDNLDQPIHLNIAGLVLFTIANIFPFLTFKMEGREQPSILISGVFEFYDRGLWELSVIVFLFAIAIPLAKLLASLAVLVPLRLGLRPAYAARVFRLVETLHPWAMTEVYLLGVMVAYVKLIDLATIEIGAGLLAFAALIVIMAAAEAAIEPNAVWERIGPAQPPAAAPPDRRSVASCHACAMVVQSTAPGASVAATCPRCGAHLHRRKSNSISRTWALVITASVLYIPANLYPVMTVISFGSGEADTILSGVVALAEAGMWPLALLVFFASVTVPMLKLIGLSFLLVSVQRQSRWRPKDRTALYRVIESVGRWSMIDVFMLAIIVALVKLGSIATIEPGVGAVAFCGVVVITILASMSFDPRLIWDGAGRNNGR